MGGTGSHAIKLSQRRCNECEGKVLSGWCGGGYPDGLAWDCRSRLLQLGPIAARVSGMEEFEEDEETLAAIDRGIKAADEGRTVSLEEVRKMIPEWIAKFESHKPR